MAVNIAGLIVLAVLYLVILLVGVLAARKKHSDERTTRMESAIVAGRDINLVVGIFTMTATAVGGGYINGTAESVATSGLVMTVAPFGIFIGLIFGGLVYAKPMREKRYLTMLDPFHEQYGGVVVFMVYLASLCGDLFWTASILSALGTSLSVIVNIDLTIAKVTSAMITVVYTMVGQMLSVAYTDVVQLCFITFGLVLSVPFVLTNENVGSIDPATSDWLGTIDSNRIGQWIDLLIAMILGTTPWQAYFQRVLSAQTVRQAQVVSFFGGLFAFLLVIPSVLIGAASKTADWNSTSLGVSPIALNESSTILPYVLNEFTPHAVSVIGLGAISASVMSSMDSAILGSSSMFTINIYKQLFRPKASQNELLWVQRITIFMVGAIATCISIIVPVIYGMYIMAADIVYVILTPQLVCALFIKFTNSYGAISGYIVGAILRLGAGEYYLNFAHFIEYPWYDPVEGQLFPYRTFSMVMSFITILVVSALTNTLFSKGVVPKKFDILKCSEKMETRLAYTQAAQDQPPEEMSCDKSCDRSCDKNLESHVRSRLTDGKLEEDGL